VVLSQAHDLMLDGVVLTRTLGTVDAPVVQVDGTPAGGTTTIAHALIVNAVAATGQIQPAVAGGLANSLVVSDSLVVSGAGQGPGITLAGGDTPANRIVRSAVEAMGASSDGVQAQSTTAGAKQLVVDSSVLSGGANAASLHSTTSNSLPGVAVGNVDARLIHATLAGAAKAVAAEATANGGLSPTGSIAVTVDRSIVRGAKTATNCGCLVANTATVTVTNSDSSTTDFFVNAGARNFHLRADAPVIDQGGPAVGGESDTDVDGQPRVAGAASDLGADEFVNQRPVGRLATPAAVRQPAAVSFDASASADPEAASGGGIASYHFDFGDGSSIDSTSPMATHVYANPGTYAARVTATDVQGLAGTPSDPVSAVVADGVAPTVRIVSPKNRAKLRLRTSKGKLAPIRFFGSAADNHGVALVGLTLRQVTKGSKCRFFDGKRSFKTVACAKPVVIRVSVQQGIWTYKVKSGVRLRKGTYELSAYAVDQGGNVSKPARIRFTLK
jgi:hypothetical protein